MKICAVICEYNPFHSGHLYQLEYAKKTHDAIICVMSGNFVQRAEPAIADKYVRAQTALKSGADMVVELPLIYATANGERFCDGAVEILSKFNNIDSLIMGSETDDIEGLKILAEIQSNENDYFKERMSMALSQGVNYAEAYTTATTETAETLGLNPVRAREILLKPNNLLSIGYIKAIKKRGLNINPIILKRKDSEHRDLFPANAYYSSATAIREMLYNNNYTSAEPYLPKTSEILFNELKNHIPNRKLFSDLAVYTLRTSDLKYLESLYDCREGLHNKLSENAKRFLTLDEVLLNTKSKRYTLSRLKRITLQAMLGITSEIMSEEYPLPPKLIAVKEDFKQQIKTTTPTLITKNTDYESFTNQKETAILSIEKKAAALYSMLTKKTGDTFYSGRIISD